MLTMGILAQVRIDPGEPRMLQATVGYALVLLVFAMGLIILWKIATGTIDISKLLEESGGGASMSRFQLLIFTFVIALSLFLLVANGNGFPEIPAGVLTLLAISATTYGVSKGIQASSDLPAKGSASQDTIATAVAAGAAAGAQTGAEAGAVTGAAAGAVAGQSGNK